MSNPFTNTPSISSFVLSMAYLVANGWMLSTSGIFLNACYQCIVFDDPAFFCDHRFVCFFFLDADMSPETENFLAYRFLKPIGQGSVTIMTTTLITVATMDNRIINREKDFLSITLPGGIKCDTVCYKACNLQIDNLICLFIPSKTECRTTFPKVRL